ncbi:MAG: PilZ domain-containing protein [Candidatus Korobacteraceae bacterium]
MRDAGNGAIIPDMCADLIHGFLSSCRHQFSWPRRDETGENYQVCVHCGAKYSYDWATMRRVALLESEADALDSGRRSLRQCGTKKAWTPRERRLHHRVDLLFRLAGSDEWIEGVTENISRSGLLFRSASPLEVGSSLELNFEMPHEVTGDVDAQVMCEGSLLRVEAVAPTRKNQQPTYMMACTITQYKFASDGERAIRTEQDA